MRGIDALFLAMTRQEGILSDLGMQTNAFRLNMLNLRPYKEGLPEQGGYRVFGSVVEGVQAGMDDLHAKIHADPAKWPGLGPDGTIQTLCDVFAPRADKNNPSIYAQDVAKWCSWMLKRPVSVSIKLRDLCPEEFGGQAIWDDGGEA